VTDNPNRYDDEEFTRWSVQADTAIVALWEAGASLENIEEIVKNALENADVKADVTIT
jgi:hypothetical protein